MGVKQQVALEITCDCDDCAHSDIGPLIGHYAGETIGECYKAAINNGWRFMRGRSGKLLAINLDCMQD